MQYILDGKTPVLCEDNITWGMWFQDNIGNRRVAEYELGEVRVSTVFLGLDHGFGDSERPILFETMVFGGSLDQEMDRYATWEEAEAGHQKMLARVRATAGME